MEIVEVPFEVTEESNAVVARDVWLSYGRKKSSACVLKGFNLTAPRAQIYALLGPSGCGKTSLLKCIMGRLKVKTGTISIFGKPPGDSLRRTSFGNIGYMPQDLGLNENLTLKETLEFFGAIAGMKKNEIEEKARFLTNFLNIRFYNKQIRNMSGGQRRRTSFAVAMLYPAELLILDEPTVGVDPALRQKIWEYLISLTNNIEKPATIFVTTHYVEEARMAHNVGFMLNGQLLAESSPKQLLTTYACDQLEKVFLKLCIERTIDTNKDASSLKSVVRVTHHPSVDKSSEKETYDKAKEVTKYDDSGSCASKFGIPRPRWFRIKALIKKGYHFFFRHLGYLIFEMGIPPFLMIFFGLAFGPIGGVPVGIVNHDSQGLGKAYLSSISKDFILPVPFDNYSEASRAAMTGSITGMIYINPNFSQSIRQRIIQGGLVSDEDLQNTFINVAVDGTNTYLALFFHVEIINAFHRFSENLLNVMNLNSAAGGEFIKTQPLRKENSNMTFGQSIFPIMLVDITFFMALALTSIALITDRNNGMYERSVIIGVGVMDFILSHLFLQCFTLVIQVVLIMVVTFPILGFTCQGSYFLVVLLTFLQGICGMTLGLVISSVCENDTTANMVGIATWLVMSFLQGFLWPLEGITYFIRYICLGLPQTYSIYALRSIANRGWGILHLDVILGFSTTTMWIVVFVALASFFSHKKSVI